MTIITSLLQAAPASGAPASAGGNGSFLIMIVLMVVVMWLFMIRPQNKQRKELEKFRNELKRGDKVVTVGGIYGTVDEIKDTTVLIKVDGDTKLRVAKNSLVRDFSKDAQQ